MNSKNNDDDVINVVGAGLTGGMVALLLARRGCRVRVLEARPDFRQAAVAESDSEEKRSAIGQLGNAATRSINLALSHRGICALKKAGLFEAVQPSLIPMYGRYMHDRKGNVTFMSYGHEDQCIYSVSRVGLNQLLLDEIERREGCEVIFDTKVERVRDDGTVVTHRGRDVTQGRAEYRGRFTIGADGAFSRVRRSIMHYSRANLNQSYIEHGYKELTIPPDATGDFALPNAEGLHIWPRHEFMLIALPNPDKSFTCTLFAPFETLNKPKTAADVVAFMRDHFPDVLSLMPDLDTEWFQNPASALITVRLSQWVHRDRIVLLGDAAHAVVPFYGQGMNAGFEDALVFDEIFEQLDGDPAKVLPRFAEVRQPIGDALADLSLHNYVEMRSHTAKKAFLLKKVVENQLNKWAPETYIPLYSMVSFTRIPYHEIVERARKQDRVFNWATAALGTALLAGAAKLYCLFRGPKKSTL